MLSQLPVDHEIEKLLLRLAELDSAALAPSEVGQALADYAHIPAFLRALLVTDGTVTMALEAFFSEPIHINTIRQGYFELPGDIPVVGLAAGAKGLFREVELVGSRTGEVYAHACSLINSDAIKLPLFEQLVDEHEGIGVVLRNVAKGSFREVLNIETGGIMTNAGMNRSYRVSLNAVPAILITEEFPLAPYL